MPRIDEGEFGLRAALLLGASYFGSIIGNLSVKDWHLEWDMLAPSTLIGMAGAIITPVANVLLAIYVLLGIAYLVGWLPRWAAAICGIGAGVVTAVTILMWRSG